jgi:amino acid transporter
LINVHCCTPIPSILFMVSQVKFWNSYSKFLCVIFFQCLLTIFLLFIPDVYSLINYVSFVEALFILTSISGLLWLRIKQPDAKRPIKVNIMFPIIFLITCGFLVISSCYVSPWEVGIGTLIIISGIPVYYLTIHHPVPALTRLSAQFNLFCSKLFLCMPNREEKVE